MQAQASDRRKYHRIGTDQVISFAPMGRGERDRLAASKNLSAGGIRFEAVGCEVDVGEVLRITFNVGDSTVVAIGRVVWATDTDPITTEFGIEFLEVDPAALNLLEDLTTEERSA